jgi:hypothetical protein
MAVWTAVAGLETSDPPPTAALACPGSEPGEAPVKVKSAWPLEPVVACAVAPESGPLALEPRASGTAGPSFEIENWR